MPQQTDSPADDYFLVTPSDADLGLCRGFMVTGAGTINLTNARMVNRDAFPVQANVIYPLVFRKVRAGGTATGIWVLK